MSDIAVREEHAGGMAVLTNEQLQYIAGTEFVPRDLRGNLPAILACVATGRALGIADMTALRTIHVIDGRPTFSAELMVLLVRRRGHSITGEVGDGSARVVGTRADTGDSMTATWTLQMAERAGLLNKQNWKRYPEAMLWARAVSQLCRMLFADCFAGATYTPEEIRDENLAGEPQASGAEPADVSQAVGPSIEPASPAEDNLFPPAEDEPPPRMPTKPMLKKLDVMVTKLSEGGHLNKGDLWRAHFLDPANGLGEDGEVHWSPLRDRLTKEQASALIERLTALEERVAGGFQPPASVRAALEGE